MAHDTLSEVDMKIGDIVEIVKHGHPMRCGAGIVVTINPPTPDSKVFPHDYPTYEVMLRARGFHIHFDFIPTWESDEEYELMQKTQDAS